MGHLFNTILNTYPHPYITEVELHALLGGTPNSRYGKVKRLLAAGKLLHVRRGLYCLTPELGCFIKWHPFTLAQYLYSPSYISLESALSFHQLIPERVYTVTSATNKRSKNFNTPLGHFSYQRLPTENFYISVAWIKENEHSFLMASPWKAICDYIFCYKKNWTSLEPLIESLRIHSEGLPILNDEEIQRLDEYYCSQRISRFLRGIT